MRFMKASSLICDEHSYYLDAEIFSYTLSKLVNATIDFHDKFQRKLTAKL